MDRRARIDRLRRAAPLDGGAACDCPQRPRQHVRCGALWMVEMGALRRALAALRDRAPAQADRLGVRRAFAKSGER